MTATRRNRERGSAMLVTLIIIASLLAGAAVLVGMQLSTNRSTDLTRSGMTALYCAEAGIEAANPIVAQNYPLWNAQMCPVAVVPALGSLGTEEQNNPTGCLPTVSGSPGTITGEPLMFNTINHDLDGDLSPDFVLYLRDNDDEVFPTPQAYGIDNDQKVFVVSTCVKFPDTPKQIRELVTFNGGGMCQQYHQQGLDCTGRGNGN